MCMDANWQGWYTAPSPRLYPHQWNWDSAFAALGWAAAGQPDRAYRELEALTGAQHPDGLIPHVAFHPQTQRYFPGPDWWPVRHGHDGRCGTTISNPPVAAVALKLIHDRYPDRPRALTVAHRLAAWHRWWLTCRDPHQFGEPVVIHPWETGRDNSPDWDLPLSRLPQLDVDRHRTDGHIPHTERPEPQDYGRYLWLVGNLARFGAHQRLAATHGPFRVLDPGVSCVLAAGCRALADIAATLDAPQLRAEQAGLADRVERALAARSDSHGLAGVVDLHTGTVDCTPSAGWVMNALRRDLTAGALDRLEHEVLDGTLASRYGIRSWPADQPGHDPVRYWRGPVWVNITWLAAHGLAEHGRPAARQLLDRIARLPEAGREYYHGDSGVGLGAHDFTWTAALTAWTASSDPEEGC